MQPVHSPGPVGRNLLLTLRYDGARYHGWQVQQNAVSVQSVFQQSLETILGGPHDIKGCSRTDTGVHALAYCVSVRTNSPIPPERLAAALNNHLPRDIAVTGCREVPPGFHARYSCVGKEYRYLIWNDPVRDPFWEGRALHYRYPLDEILLNRAAFHFTGRRDFASLCSAKSVMRAEVFREGPLVVFCTRADGFLYHMVRIMVGTLLRVAEGKIAPEQLPAVLDALDRGRAGPTAPPQGLYLSRVFYDRDELLRVEPSPSPPSVRTASLAGFPVS